MKSTKQKTVQPGRWLALTLPALCGISLAHGGNFQGNGLVGPIDFNFVKFGSAVNQYLKYTPEGRKLVTDAQLDLPALGKWLDPERIEVIETSAPEAASDEKIQLKANEWSTLGKSSSIDYSRVAEVLFEKSGQSADQAKAASAQFRNFDRNRRMLSGVEVAIAFPIVNYSAPIVALGEPATGGNGCPGGKKTARVWVNAKRGIAEIDFSKYGVEVGEDRGLDRKTCNLAIPADVPAGYRLVVKSAELRGLYDLPAGANVTAKVETFFAGTTGPVISDVHSDPDHAISGRIHLKSEAKVTTDCGQSTNIRVNSSLLLKRGADHAPAAATMDRLHLRFSLEKCD